MCCSSYRNYATVIFILLLQNTCHPSLLISFPFHTWVWNRDVHTCKQPHLISSLFTKMRAWDPLKADLHLLFLKLCCNDLLDELSVPLFLTHCTPPWILEGRFNFKFKISDLETLFHSVYEALFWSCMCQCAPNIKSLKKSDTNLPCTPDLACCVCEHVSMCANARACACMCVI